MKKSVLKLAALAAGSLAAAGVCIVAKKVLQKTKAIPQDSCEFAERAEYVQPDVYAAVRDAYDGGPNANPVYSPKVETPLTADGKIDVMKLASPEDFSNWEEHGCQG